MSHTHPIYFCKNVGHQVGFRVHIQHLADGIACGGLIEIAVHYIFRVADSIQRFAELIGP